MNQGQVNCRSLVDYYLGRIKENENLNIFIEVFGQEAQLQAQKIDRKIREGKAGRLVGMAVALKTTSAIKTTRFLQHLKF